MRVEIAGSQISDAVVDVLDTLQNEADVARAYIDTLDALTRALILDIDSDDADDASTLSRLRAPVAAPRHRHACITAGC